MNKLLGFFALMFTLGTIISALLEGGQPLTSTRLSAAVADDVLVIPVSTVSGFQNPLTIADITLRAIVIGDETISYTETRVTPNCPSPYATAAACFIVSARGAVGDAASHRSGAQVNTPASGYINQALDYKIIERNEEFIGIGIFKVPNINPIALFGFMAKAISWDYYFLSGPFGFLRLFGMILSIGFLWTVVGLLIPMIQGLKAITPGLNRL